MTANQIALSKLREEARHNRVSEVHEHYDTRTRRQQADAATSQADTAAKQLAVNWWSAQEAQRSAMAKEAETYRHNYQQEQLDSYRYMTAAAAAQDQARAALQQAGTAARNATTNENVLAETIRRNMALESQASKELQEQSRHNRAAEGVSYAQVSEQKRANVAQEQLKAQYQQELARHNVEAEKVATSQAMSASRQASAAEQSAVSGATHSSAAMVSAQAAQTRAETDQSRVILEGLRTGSAIGRDVMSTIGGLFK